MTEAQSEADPGSMPEDTATLYSQAQITGSRYGDFSASRKQVRGQFGHGAIREFSETLSARSGPVRVPDAGPQESIPEVPPSADVPVPDQEPPAVRHAGAPNRWYALQSVLFPPQTLVEPVPEAETGYAQTPPMMAVISVAGGVGKTCLVATLGRTLSAVGEQVLLVDLSPCGLLPFYFGSHEVKPGVVRTFSSPVQPGQSDAPVRVLSLDADCFDESSGEQDPLRRQMVRQGRGTSRLLLDVGTANRDLIRRLLRLRPTILVPLLPDMSSLACLAPLEALLGGASGREAGIEAYYLLNQFDASLSLHLDVRVMLQRQLGGRLLPFVVHRSPAVSEAVAEGMTVIDYAPGSGAAEDYRQLAGWLRSFAPPAAVSYGGMRWTER